MDSDEIVWKFGLKDKQSLDMIVGFLKGLQNLGSEIFQEKLASIIMENIDNNRLLSPPEIFVANLADRFYFVMSNPFETSSLIDFHMALSDIRRDQIRAILSGQAMLLYASFLSEKTTELNKYIDKIFQHALSKVKPGIDSSKYIGKGNCFLGSLSLSDLISFHHNLRLVFIQQKNETELSTESWGLTIEEASGKPVNELSYNMESGEIAIYSGYLSIFGSFLAELLHCRPVSISFGTSKLKNLRFFNGKDYSFIASNPENLFRNKEFREKLLMADKEILGDFLPEIKKFIIEKILVSEGQKLGNQTIERLFTFYDFF